MELVTQVAPILLALIMLALGLELTVRIRYLDTSLKAWIRISG